MLSAEERYRLLEEASALSARWDYTGVLELVESVSDPSAEWDPELTYLHALAQYRSGEYEEAARLLACVEAAAERRGKDRLYCRRISLMGAIDVERGDLSIGRERFSEALFIATTRDYKAQVASATMNLGVISSICCEWDEALASFERAIVAYEQIGHLYNLAGAHHNLGIIFRETGKYAAAHGHFDTSLQLFQICKASAEIAYSLSERALLTNAEGDLELAESTARKSLAMLVTLRNPREEAEALQTLGIILRTKGKLRESNDCFTMGLQLATRARAQMLEAGINEEMALLYSQWNRHAKSRLSLAAAERIYRKMGAVKRAERAQRRISSATYSGMPPEPPDPPPAQSLEAPGIIPGTPQTAPDRRTPRHSP
jgi:tetratricopeptide (TPR) repeat protein